MCDIQCLMYFVIVQTGQAHVQCLKLALSTPPFVFHLDSNERAGLATAVVLLDLQEPPNEDVCLNLYIGVRYTAWADASGVFASTNGTSLLPDRHYMWSQWFTWKAAHDSSIVKNSSAQVLYLPKQIQNGMFYMFQVHIKRGKRFRAKIAPTAGWLSRVAYIGTQGIAQGLACGLVSVSMCIYSLHICYLVPMTLEPFAPSTRRVQENSTVTLVCKVTGKPLPEVTWLQSLESPSPTTTEGVEIKGATLRIDHFQPQNQGAYVCAAVQYMVNIDGEFQKTVKFTTVTIELTK